MMCPRCTALIADDYLYCPRCGQSTAPRGSADNSPASVGGSSPVSTADTASGPNGKAGVSGLKPGFFALTEEEVSSLLGQANLLRVRSHWDDATEACVTVLRAQPGNATAHSLLGDIYRDQGNPEEAVQWYRMAVDLHPNAVDESKLRQMDEERAIRAAEKAGVKSLSAAAIASAGVPGGTSALMGLSPRRWLNAITVAALAFLAIMAVGLFLYGRGPGRSDDTAHSGVPTDGNLYPLTDRHANDILPPIRHGGGTVLPPGEKSREVPPANYAAGTGLPPDVSGSSTSAAQSTAITSTREVNTAAGPVSPAPVGQVRPLQNPPAEPAPDGDTYRVPPAAQSPTAGNRPHRTNTGAMTFTNGP